MSSSHSPFNMLSDTMILNTSFKNHASHCPFRHVENINAVILTMEQDEGFQGICLPCVTQLSSVEREQFSGKGKLKC